ncbi:NfeD-like C-terminal, partner-binding [Fusobacterium necrophorum subsp. necrophorum]|nr:NfeD-like C-terminal, partner-binding [Fusobacterium necrophorum subsp. necrophorum]
MGIIFWIVVTCILAGLEIIIPSLITIWFALAAFVLVAISFVPLIVFSPFMEWKVFIFLSILFLVITRPLSKKYFQNRRQEFRGDYLGKELVIEKVIRTGYYEARFKEVFGLYFPKTVWKWEIRYRLSLLREIELL